MQHQELLEKLFILFIPAFQYLKCIFGTDIQQLPQAQVISPLKFSLWLMGMACSMTFPQKGCVEPTESQTR